MPHMYRTSAFGPAMPPRLTSGGFALFANGTGTASFDSFRVTLVPDPTASLVNVGRAANSLVNWNANLPANTSLAVTTSTDNGVTYQSVGNAGGAIPGLTTQLYKTLSLQKQPDAYLPLDDPSGVTARDLSTHSNAGTISGGVGYGVQGPLLGPGETSETGMMFNGTNAQITLPGGLNPTSSTSFSFACWVKIASYVGSSQSIFANYSSNLSFTLNFGAGIAINNGILEFDVVDAGTNLFVATHALSAISLNTWHHIVGTFGSSIATLYIDGRFVASTSVATIVAANTPVIIGNSYYNDFFAGNVAQCATYSGNNALVASDVSALYNAGLNGLGTTFFDTFAANTSANYTSTSIAGGSTGTWTFDTANSRLVGTGGTNAILRYDGLFVSDVTVSIIADILQSAGIVVRMQDTSNMYIVYFSDSAGTSTFSLYKVVAGSSTQLGSTTAFSFVDTTHHTVQLSAIGTTISVTLDGTTLLSVTDSAIAGPGKIGLTSGTEGRFYELRADAVGPDVTNTYISTQVTLTSTDPTATPQVLDLQTFASDATVGLGALVSSKQYQQTYVSANVDDLNKESDYWWSIVSSLNGSTVVNKLYFQSRTATLSPWPLDSANTQTINGQSIGDVLVANAGVSNSADLYRNQQILKKARGTASFAQNFVGDGQTRTWNVANPLASPPTAWTVNGQAVTFGVQGVDTGKQYYYQIGSTALTQDNSGNLLEATDTLSISYVGSYTTDVIRNNVNPSDFPGTVSQSALAAIDGTSGIVANVIDISQQNMTVAAAQAYGDQLLQRYGVIGETFVFTTLRSGLVRGQQLTLFVPEMSLNDVQTLVTDVSWSQQLAPGVTGGILWMYKVTCTTAANLGDYVKLLASALRS